MSDSIDMHGLTYPGFSLVYMQVFSVEAVKPVDFGLFFEEDVNPIDRQIFEIADRSKPPVKRYKFKGFDFEITLDEPYEVRLEGHMHLEMSVFFGQTVVLTYRMVVDGQACRTTAPLATDHLIALASLNMGAEHWGGRDSETATNINLDVEKLYIKNLHIGPDGEWLDEPVSLFVEGYMNSFREVCRRYKKHINRCARLPLKRKTTQNDALQLLRSDRSDCFGCPKCSGSAHRHDGTDSTEYRDMDCPDCPNSDCPMKIRDLNYVYVDVWESVAHSDGLFTSMKEEEIIEHIYQHHRRELVGLMTLYPAEWPYRTLEAFDDVCGDNVAIDTDDLILVNQNLCVVFGTYGLRGKDSPTDWKKHLEERSRYHVSWPEYMLILEMVLAKKYTVARATEEVLACTSGKFDDPNGLIGKNAYLSLKITALMLQLDAVKYSKFMSHKVMFDRTSRRLEVELENAKLERIMENVDKSLHNLSEYRSLTQRKRLNIVLAGISVASLFQILFMEVRLPYLSMTGMEDIIASVVIWAVTALICVGILYLIVTPFHKILTKRKLKRK